MSIAFEPHLPDHIGTGSIQRQDFDAVDILLFRKWQGISLLRYFYMMLLLLDTILFLIITINGWIDGSIGIILFVTFIMPLIWIVSIICIRVTVEVCLSVLLLPTLLSTNYTRLRTPVVTNPVDNNNLASLSQRIPPPGGIAPDPPSSPEYRGFYTQPLTETEA